MAAQTQALTISNISIRQDVEGRYSINDLHKASGNKEKNKPANWLRSQQTVDIIKEIEKAQNRAILNNQQLTESGEFKAVCAKKGTGTFVVRDLVYAYAMWISAAFALQVIRAYDGMVTGRPEVQQTLPLHAAVADIKRARLLVSFFQGKRTVSLVDDDACCVSITRWSAFIRDYDEDINRETLIDIIGACALRLSRLH